MTSKDRTRYTVIIIGDIILLISRRYTQVYFYMYLGILCFVPMFIKSFLTCFFFFCVCLSLHLRIVYCFLTFFFFSCWYDCCCHPFFYFLFCQIKELKKCPHFQKPGIISVVCDILIPNTLLSFLPYFGFFCFIYSQFQCSLLFFPKGMRLLTLITLSILSKSLFMRTGYY